MKACWRNFLIVALFLPALAGCDPSSMSISMGPIGGTNVGNEEYTIYLLQFVGKGQGRFEEAERYKAQTAEQSGWKNLFVVHEEGRSVLYVGKYRDYAAAKADCNRIQKWKTKTGVTLYGSAMVADIPGQEVGPAALNLKNTAGVYSVVIAVFFDDEKEFTGRKHVAVEYAKELRSKGEEAYYCHGPAQSAVCIGSYPKESIKRVPVRASPDPNDENAGFIWKSVIEDPKMLAILAKYPHLSENGLIRWKALPDIYDPKKKNWMQPETYPIKIPGKNAEDAPDVLDRSGHPIHNQPGEQQPYPARVPGRP